MSWLKRVFGGGPAARKADAPAAGDELLRCGFEREINGDLDGAAELYRAIAEDDPAHAQAMFYLGRHAANDHRMEEAIELFRRAAAECPDDALFQMGLGDALARARRFEAALAAYGVCRALQTENTVVTSNYAGALIELDRREEARVELERLLEVAPYASEVHFNLGGIYREYCRTDDAIAAYTRSLELNPSSAQTYSNLLLELNMSASLSAQAIYAEHRRFGEHFARRYELPEPDRKWPRRLRTGYVSADFRFHVVSFFMEPILTHHDRERFEIFCYHAHIEKDKVTDALRPLADRWLDCEDLSDAELAERIRADRIDILVDLGGHTAHNRLVAFTRKPAPVQVTYLGYPNTTGLTSIDYRITDPVADPPGESDRLNSERLIRLPHSHFCFRPGPDAPQVEPLPADTNGYVTFGCFNHFAKVSNAFLDTVARVLKAVPNARFTLKGRPLSIQEVAARVRDHFERLGVDPARLDLRGWEATPRSHLRTYGAVDIALDTFPYSGATTTCEALWMGVPIVSLAGERHSGRMCASILAAVGLGEWVARDPDGYVANAVELSGDIGRLGEMRRGMRERMKASPLMNEKRFTRDLEACYVEMWERSVVTASLRGGATPVAVDALLEEARSLKASSKPVEAAQACRKVLAQVPDHSGALELLWDAGFDAGSPGTAIDPLVKAIALRGDDSRLHYMLGCALEAQGKAEDAMAAFRLAIGLAPGFAKAHNNLGCMLEAVGRLEEAADAYARACELEPGLAQARFNLGNLQQRLGNRAQAIDHIKQALALEPRNPAWCGRLGELQLEDARLDDALASFRAAVALDPADGRAHTGLGNTLLALGRVDEALAALRKALELDPSNAVLDSLVLCTQQLLAVENPQALLDQHKAWAGRHARGIVQFTTRTPRQIAPGRRINVAYLAADFTDPRIASCLEAVLPAHDRDRFEIFCYSGLPLTEEGVRRLRAWNCTVRDTYALSELQTVDRMRADSIEILIDLGGHAHGARPLILARRPAPVQIAWLGYAATSGVAAIDFRISDAVADPPGQTDRFHTEKLLRLAGGHLCYTPPADATEIVAPAELGPGNILFASFNEPAAITPAMIAAWAGLLRELPDARLRLQAAGFSAESARRRVLGLFAAQGIASDRVDARPDERTLSRRLAAYHDVDVALDVHPRSGREAVCEALWMGVPVVTLAGKSYVSRAGAALLHSAGLGQCVAATPAEYAAIAKQLAGDVAGRRALRRQLRERMRAAPLLDGARLARELEAAFVGALEEKARAARSAASAEPLRLHIGGVEAKAGWKVLDVRPGPNVDFVGDCARDLGQFEDGSVAEIYASHVVEHLGFMQELPHTLAEFHRILRPGGNAKISVPDIERLCRMFLDPELTRDDRFFVMRMMFGSQLHEHDFHCVGLNFELLREYLFAAGFTRVERVADFGLFNDASNGRYGDTPISLNVIAYK